MNNLRSLRSAQKFSPQRIGGLKLWLSAADYSTFALSYNALAETASGTSGTHTITASADVSTKLFAGNKIKVGASDIYTIASVSTATITTAESLSASYTAGTALSLGKASQWNDKSGNGNHASQATGAAQPTYVANRKNGKSSLKFTDGNFMELPSGIFSISNAANTAFAVTKCTDESTDRFILSLIGSGGAERILLFSSSSAGYYGFGQGGGAGAVYALSTKSDYGIINAKASGTGQNISVNNNTPSSNSSAVYGAATSAYIGTYSGSGNYYIGDIAELVVYNRALADAETMRVNRYLANRWGILLSGA